MTASLQEAHQRICDVEQKLDLLRHEVDGWSAWPLIRFEVSLLLAQLTFPHAASTGRLARGLRALPGLPSLFTRKTARHLVKTYSSGLAEQSGDRYRDIWFDDVILAAGSVFKIEAANSPTFAGRSRHALVTRDLSSSAIDMAAMIQARRSPSADVPPAARAIGRALREDLGLTLIDDGWVSRRFQRFAASKRVYGMLLRRVRPSFVLVADPGEHALVAAAKESGATVLELQHGISDRSNVGYVWPAHAAPYRHRMPVPDRLLLYGEHWRRELDPGSFWGDSLRVVGSPRLDRYRERAGVRSNEVCTILFTTQGLDLEQVTTFLRDTLAILVPRIPLQLVVKLHPIHDSDPRPYLRGFAAFREQVDVLGGDQGESTFDLLRRAHLHVSIASASHYDAVGLGVPTAILPFRTHEVVLPMYRAGHAHLTRTPQDLANLVQGWQNLRLPADIGEYYFRSGARANILRELGLPSEERQG